jgi:signal transduction histidine kinase/DNA-binding response OmpR family regulator/ligand-binding sensor domain-containing protein
MHDLTRQRYTDVAALDFTLILRRAKLCSAVRMLQSLLLSSPFFSQHLPGLFLLAFCSGAVPLRSQDLSQLNHYSTSDGLPANQIGMVKSDSEGFIWVMTRQGLARYDGRRFVPFSVLCPQAELPSQGYQHMLIDGHDLLWLSTADGLFRISLITFEVDFFSQKLLPQCVDAQGNAWFISDSGISRYNRSNGDFLEFPLIENGDTIRFNAICKGKGNTLLVKSLGRLSRFDTQKMTFELLAALPKELVNAALVVASDAEGMLWLSVWYHKTSGLVHYDPYRDTVLRRFGSATHPISSTDINRIFPADDQVWLATNSGGLCRYSVPENAFYCHPVDDKNPNGLWMNQMTDVFKDNFGNLWVGTLFGLYKAPSSTQTTQLLAYMPFNHNSVVSRPVTALEFVTDTLLAIGTMKGLSLYDRHQKTFLNLHLPLYNDNPYNDQIRAFTRDAPGSFWTATWSGLFRLDSRNGRIIEYYITHPNAGENHPAAVNRMEAGAIYRLFRDREGVLWASTFNSRLVRITGTAGNRRFEYLEQQLKARPAPTNRVEAFLDLDERFLLLGTADGLLRYDRLTRRTEPVPVKFPGLESPVPVWSIARSRQGDLLLIVKNRPFRLTLNKDGGVATPIAGSLHLMPCQQIIEDNAGAVWVTQEDGVAQLDAGKNIGRLYDSRHYLLDNVFATRPPFPPVKDRNGNLYFGGTRGVTILNPVRFARQESVQPILKITSLKVNGAAFNPDTTISRLHTLHLSWEQANLGFEFSVLNAVVPTLCRFAYRLDGGEQVELESQSTLNLSNLAPGTYRLQLTAANSDGVWDKKGVTLRIVIHPPWWRSVWAYLVYASLLACLAWWAYRFQLRQKLAQQEARQLREMDAFKSRFFTNITHEFRTPLTVILGMTERALSDGVAQRHPATIGQPLTLIKRNGQNLLRLINQILDLSKLENNALKLNYIYGDVVAYLRYITESLQSLAHTHNLALHVESDRENILMDYDPERLQQVVYNLLSNSIKFTPAGGRVDFRVTSAGLQTLPTLVITVSDTGVGIPADELPFLFDRFFQAGNQDRSKAGGTGIGLALTKELVHAMSGDITVESAVGKGTITTVRLPITRVSPLPYPSPTERAAIADTTSLLPAESGIDAPSDSSFNIQHSSLPNLLVIEDNPDVMAYIIACLENEYRIECAYNGRMGIEKALETVPDLILSDVMMPEKDGLAVCDALKNDERTSHIPIVLLTAKADVDSRLAGLRRGADVYLSKPFHEEELRLNLSNLLEQRRKWQERFGKFDLSENTATAEMPDLFQADVELEDAFLKKIRLHIEQHLADSGFDGPRLARAMLLSEVQLYRKIKALTGKSTAIYIRSIRLHKGLELLRNTNLMFRACSTTNLWC